MRRSSGVKVALYCNALALGVVGLALLNGNADRRLLPAAVAQQIPQPIAGGAGLFLMPGQLSPSTWGCYVMDVDRQTLMAYQYSPGERMLRLMAARDFSYDRRLRRYNTDPSPDEIKSLTDKEQGREQAKEQDKVKAGQ